MVTKINKLIALAFILVITLQTVFAFGITPGRTTITYDHLDRQFFFTVINSESEDINLEFSVTGELADYIVLDETKSSMNADEKYKLFRFTLDVDDEFASPGLYKGKINVKRLSEKEQGFGVGLSVNSQVVLKVTETSIPLREDVFSKEEEATLENLKIFNALILIALLLVLILIVLNKFIRRK